MKKLILLCLMTSLFAFGNNKAVKVNAEEVMPEPGTSAMFHHGGSLLKDKFKDPKDNKIDYVKNVVSIKVSNKSSDLPAKSDLICDPIGLSGCTSTDASGNPIKTADGHEIAAYLTEATGSTDTNKRYDCVLYANVETIYSNPESQYLFAELPALEQIDIKLLNTSKTAGMNCLFEGDPMLKSVDLSTFDTSSLTEMLAMFADCPSLTSINFGDSFDTSKVTRFEGLFLNCESLTSIDLSNFNTSSAKSVPAMFAGCTSLKTLDLSTFDLSHIDGTDNGVGTYLDNFLLGCTSLEYIKTPAVMPADHNIVLPDQFSPYCDITEVSAANLADHPVINLPADKFIYEWKALRTSGGAEGICGALNQGTTDNTALKTLLSDYDKFDAESKTYINKAKDTDGVTIGESVEYINNVLDGTQTTEKDYGITSDADIMLNAPVLSSKTSLIVIITIIGLTAIAGYYFYNKKRQLQ